MLPNDSHPVEGANIAGDNEPGDSSPAVVLLFCIAVFTSAFLLFQVQPVIGKFILPWFGSSPGVWVTCMLFFQILLLAGYGYAHFTVSQFSRKQQALLHGTLLVIALITLPIAPDPAWKPVGADAPIGSILLILAVSVGVPYLLLSASGPLLQGWFARLLPKRSPYRLYALSNAGSLLGLLSYPFIFEPNFALRSQSIFWSIGYGFFAVICTMCAWLLLRSSSRFTVVPDVFHNRDSTTQALDDTDLNTMRIASWFLLSACGSGLLLATTNQMSIDVAIVPFLWVLPLSIYLLSFILCFDSSRWYWRRFYFSVLPLALINSVRLLYNGIDLGLTEQIVGYSFTLFICCMCMHGELARLKPSPKHLTFFYLLVSTGGAAGGMFVAVFSPAFFSGYWGLRDGHIDWPTSYYGPSSGVGLAVRLHPYRVDESRSIESSSWLLMTNNEEFLALTEVHRDELVLPPARPLWTDDFSSLFEVLKTDQ